MTECPEQTAHSVNAGSAKEGHFSSALILFAEAEQLNFGHFMLSVPRNLADCQRRQFRRKSPTLLKGTKA